MHAPSEALPARTQRCSRAHAQSPCRAVTQPRRAVSPAPQRQPQRRQRQQQRRRQRHSLGRLMVMASCRSRLQTNRRRRRRPSRQCWPPQRQLAARRAAASWRRYLPCGGVSSRGRCIGMRPCRLGAGRRAGAPQPHHTGHAGSSSWPSCCMPYRLARGAAAVFYLQQPRCPRSEPHERLIRPPPRTHLRPPHQLRLRLATAQRGNCLAQRKALSHLATYAQPPEAC